MLCALLRVGEQLFFERLVPRRRFAARCDGSCRPLACDGERQLVDVDRATYDACRRWTEVRLLYAPDNSLLLSTPVGAPAEPR